nr:hypothetical protein [uncultured Kingella sp.]
MLTTKHQTHFQAAAKMRPKGSLKTTHNGASAARQHLGKHATASTCINPLATSHRHSNSFQAAIQKPQSTPPQTSPQPPPANQLKYTPFPTPQSKPP